MSKVLVTGATGNVGREVVTQLLNEGIEVRALIRNPASASLPNGVEIAQGDLSDTKSLVKSAEGVEAVFLVWPGLPTSLAPAMLEAFKPHVSRVVYLSSMSIPKDRTIKIDPITDFHNEIEQQIEHSGLDWTFLRISGLATNTLGWGQQTRSGDVVRWPFAAAARSLIHEKDVAAVAVRALTSAQHHGAKYDLTGPQVLTQAEQVRAIGDAIGRPLRYEETSPEVARQQMLAYFPPATVDGMIKAWGSLVEHPERMSHTVEEVTGTPAHPYSEWARDHVHDFR
ncbi:SDR family oxidoreductase [Ktedonospora formicarum]|uniref:Nucleotide-diphosphate-sugar epimerase n=1 Tax=Ktedonospora formicarum TaxID=2778364 RepID=A0A8J3MT34_9CHLR|nr:NAD(P)H-binding protein [Ktedonospora formicarum]GHO46750.1 nucleotide-diphosphate-sugar epimerase [Ktedonospora formicarum]